MEAGFSRESALKLMNSAMVISAGEESYSTVDFATIDMYTGELLSLIHISFLRDANTSASVIEIINLLDEVRGAKTFNSLFPVILTDNGSEFSNPKEIEKRSTCLLYTPRCV